MITRIPLRAFSLPNTLRAIPRASIKCPNQPRSPTTLLVLRPYSTPTIDAAPEEHSRASPPPSIRPTPKRSVRPYIYASIFALIGVIGAQYVNLIISPPPLPSPNTHEDELMLEFLAKKAEKIPLVASLTEDPNWIQYEAYEGVIGKDRSHRFTTGPLGGARGIGGYQRVFFNETTGEHIVVVWIGGALAGWPGVTHGGVSATLMDETLGRCAIRQFPGRTGVTANLELNYLKPLVTNSFYVMRAILQKEGSTDRKQFVSGRLETLDGIVCVEAKGLFVVPKRFETNPVVSI